MPWTNLTNAAHTRLWEHLNNLYAALMPGPRHYAATVDAENVASGTTLATIVIPAQPFACRIGLRYGGMVGYVSTGATVAASVAASAGTITTTCPGANAYTPAGGVWVEYEYNGYVTLAAGTATTLTLGSYSTPGTSYFRGMFTADVLFVGEYA